MRTWLFSNIGTDSYSFEKKMMVACLSTFFDCCLHLHGKFLSCLPTFMLQGRSKLFHGGVAQVYIYRT